jgi:antitoxin YefM
MRKIVIGGGLEIACTEKSTYICGKKMIKIMRTANYTDLRNNLKTYIDSVIEDSDTVIINRSGGHGVVLISLDEYNSLKETEYILSSAETMAAIRKAEDELKNGDVYSQMPDESINAFLKRVSCTE